MEAWCFLQESNLDCPLRRRVRCPLHQGSEMESRRGIEPMADLTVRSHRRRWRNPRSDLGLVDAFADGRARVTLGVFLAHNPARDSVTVDVPWCSHWSAPLRLETGRLSPPSLRLTDREFRPETLESQKGVEPFPHTVKSRGAPTRGYWPESCMCSILWQLAHRRMHFEISRSMSSQLSLWATILPTVYSFVDGSMWW